MILVKGESISFEMLSEGKIMLAAESCFEAGGPSEDKGPIIKLPSDYKMIHDSIGDKLNYCDLYFGQVKETGQSAQMDRYAKAYFGRGWKASKVIIDVPRNPNWEFVGDARQVYYTRIGQDSKKYWHVFDEKVEVKLFWCKHETNGSEWWRIETPTGCVISDRGIVKP